MKKMYVLLLIGCLAFTGCGKKAADTVLEEVGTVLAENTIENLSKENENLPLTNEKGEVTNADTPAIIPPQSDNPPSGVSANKNEEAVVSEKPGNTADSKTDNKADNKTDSKADGGKADVTADSTTGKTDATKTDSKTDAKTDNKLDTTKTDTKPVKTDSKTDTATKTDTKTEGSKPSQSGSTQSGTQSGSNSSTNSGSNSSSASGHVHKFEKTVFREANCQTPKVIWEKCSCGAEGEMYTEGDPLPHDYSGEYQVFVPASCKNDGLGGYVCTMCGGRSMSGIGIQPHEYVSEVISQGDCRSEGTIRYTCRVCGHSYNEFAMLHADDHEYVTGTEAVWSDEAFAMVDVPVTYCKNCGKAP